MRAIDIDLVKSLRDRALSEYENKMKKFSESQDPSLAQAVNDAWLRYKKLEADFKDSSIQKTMGDLYGC